MAICARLSQFSFPDSRFLYPLILSIKVSGALLEVYSCVDLIELKMAPLTLVQGDSEPGGSHQEGEWWQVVGTMYCRGKSSG